MRAVWACPNGIFRMSPDVEDLVQTSNNLARVRAADGEYKVLCLTRGSVDTEKMDLARAIRCAFELIGADVEFELIHDIEEGRREMSSDTFHALTKVIQ